MKKGLMTLLITALALVATWSVAGDDKEIKIKTSAVCEMCKERIERNLSYEKGVKEATLDVKTKVVTIKYNPKKTDAAKLKANISKTGYDADEVTADDAGYKKLPSCCKKDSPMHHDH
nr:heavy metal-associated domain-containing protein [uncultured Arsenicibacter sp.]